MIKKTFSFLCINCMTVLFLLSITGCGETVHLNTELPPEGDQTVNFPAPDPSNIVWYVAGGGNDAETNTGTDHRKPLASVQAALERIKSAYQDKSWKAGDNAVIVIRGTLYGSGSFGSTRSMIEISGTNNYPPIILEGDTVWGGIINARRNENDDGRVLYIANNKVTLGNKLILTGGYALRGGAVCVGDGNSSSAGEFVMAGGEISNNVAAFGGAVAVYAGKMSMTGGIIRNNRNTKYSNAMGSGGGVYINAGTSVTMSGGEISGNGGAETDKGGGVFIEGKGRFTMENGKIANNSSISQGGGVQVIPFGEFTLSGGTINGNRTGKFGGGGVYVVSQDSKFTQTGGTISGNTPTP